MSQDAGCSSMVVATFRTVSSRTLLISLFGLFKGSWALPRSRGRIRRAQRRGVGTPAAHRLDPGAIPGRPRLDWCLADGDEALGPPPPEPAHPDPPIGDPLEPALPWVLPYALRPASPRAGHRILMPAGAESR